jgi:methylenetetrahydrofolate reductase (NADPH)
MVIQSYGGFKRMTAFCKNRVPLHVSAALDAVKDDDAAVKAAGVRLGVEMCRELIAAGSKGLHFYTLNLEKITYGILEELGLKKAIVGGEEATD